MDERNEDFPLLIERGICNLHIVHNAFKIRAKPSNCDLEKIVNSAYHKFDDTSVFWQDYLYCKRSLLFCGASNFHFIL